MLRSQGRHHLELGIILILGARRLWMTCLFEEKRKKGSLAGDTTRRAHGRSSTAPPLVGLRVVDPRVHVMALKKGPLAISKVRSKGRCR